MGSLINSVLIIIGRIIGLVFKKAVNMLPAIFVPVIYEAIRYLIK